MLGRHADAFFRKQMSERVLAAPANGESTSLKWPDRGDRGTGQIRHVRGQYEMPGPQTVVSSNQLAGGEGGVMQTNPRDMLPGMGMYSNPKDMLPGMGMYSNPKDMLPGMGVYSNPKDMLPGMGVYSNPKDMLPGMGAFSGTQMAAVAVAAGLAWWLWRRR